jgi:hypothetical protein
LSCRSPNLSVFYEDNENKHQRHKNVQVNSLVEESARSSKQRGKSIRKKLEAISKIGFWFNFEAGPRFEPEEYYSILRIQNEAPTKKLGQKTFLRWLLYMLWQFKAVDPRPYGPESAARI